MIDFVGILKKTISSQSNITLQVRKRIYKRAIETLERQFVEATVPHAIADEQRKSLQNAIAIVEEEYLADEKELLSSIIGWNSKNISKNDKHIQNTILPQENAFSVLGTGEKQQIIAVRSKDNEILNKSSMPDAEPVNMEACLSSQHVQKSILKASSPVSPLQGDNSHIVSHIFSQALRRANRSSIQKRIVIGVTIIVVFIILIIGFFLIGGRMFVSNDRQFSGGNVAVTHAQTKMLSVHKKLTQRLLEDGSEIDVGLDKTANSSNEEKTISSVISSNVQAIGESGEAIFYKARTDYDSEKVAMGSVHWKLIKESRMKGVPAEEAIQGDIKIPDEGVSLRLILRRNTDLSFPAAYIIDVIFILSDKFSGKAVSNIQMLTFKASEQSIGQALARTVTAKISDNFFLVALSGSHPFLDRNLQLMRELDWMRLVLTDKNGRINELTFSKGAIGEAIFKKVIGKWLAQPDKQTALDHKK
ncbi:hypothetical protein [Bartonella raoultii]|uniref:Transmembrane protein n=1 Tax=Bartonella raoultii TaxID=1457020 RepID=A0ABS7I6J2_9HYPH|nr:hypothetical protein [Bartonella raoultii]MBX4336529.1 hypothetical protein [Bartonella raoultii]